MHILASQNARLGHEAQQSTLGHQLGIDKWTAGLNREPKADGSNESIQYREKTHVLAQKPFERKYSWIPILQCTANRYTRGLNAKVRPRLAPKPVSVLTVQSQRKPFQPWSDAWK